MSGRSPTEIAEGPSGTPPRRRRTGYRRAFWVSLGISTVLHGLAVVLYSNLFIGVPSWSPSAGSPGQPLVPDGTELVNLETLPEDETLEVLHPEEEPEPEVIQPAPPTGDPGGREAEQGAEPFPGAPAPTAAERLRPRAGDLRLWAPVDPEVTRLSREELMRILLAAELEDAADSMALAAELARRVTDWTYTDDEGRRWGVSPGKLHLGDITLPLPFGFGTPPMIREQNAERLWAWDDIERGAASKGVQDYWKERAEAIRRRRDAERRPDTTGIIRRE